MHIVLIRTAGNQRYIFSSNKRKEIVGASDLIAKVNGLWAMNALEQVFPGFSPDWRIATHDAELLVTGAGRVTVLVRDAERGRRLVTTITTRALREAPGLDVRGVVVEYTPGELAAGNKKAARLLGTVRDSLPGPQSRFLRLPLVEPCESNGLPAMEIRPESDDEPPRERSAVAVAKLDAYPAALDRLARDANGDKLTMRGTVDWLGLEADWVAVIHADGNSMGALFGSLEEYADSDEAYADLYRNVSNAVDTCARKALIIALDRTRQELQKPPKVLPLVLGGDDLTVVCEGAAALPFTRHYLEAFEELTAAHEAIRKTGREGLSAAAGVAIVKRNYPFHFAYRLAEQLTDHEAKTVKEHASALAFVVLMESAAADLPRIRASLHGRSASPYLVGRGRCEGTRWEDLERRVAAVKRRDPQGDGPLIPNSVLHDLREALCLDDGNIAASRLELLRRRFAGDPARSAALDELTADLNGLPDAMAAAAFMPDKTEVTA